MQFTVNEAFNASYEIALADKYPNIRLFTVGQVTISPTVHLLHSPNAPFFPFSPRVPTSNCSLLLFLLCSHSQILLPLNNSGVLLLLQQLVELTGRIIFHLLSLSPLCLPSASPLPPLCLPSASPLPPLCLPSASPLPPLCLPSASPLPPLCLLFVSPPFTLLSSPVSPCPSLASL